jgi:hypothetical protein
MHGLRMILESIGIKVRQDYTSAGSCSRTSPQSEDNLEVARQFREENVRQSSDLLFQTCRERGGLAVGIP